MPRPTKERRIEFLPKVVFFKPAGTPLKSLKQVTLSFEELEAIRLKDLEKLEQQDCADKMQVSRPTFARILNSAREKLADALIHGKAIKIEGGNYEVAVRNFFCQACGHHWEMPFGMKVTQCPVCQSREFNCNRHEAGCCGKE